MNMAAIKHYLAWLGMIVVAMVLLSITGLFAQITGPSAVSFSGGPYQVTADDVNGSLISAYGWNIQKRAYLDRPVRAVVKVDSVLSTKVRWWYSINYEGKVDTVEITISKDASFWIPDSQTAAGKGIPDSLFYLVIDTTGIAVGQEFLVRNIRVMPGDQYSHRLVFSTDTVKGTQSLTSQPVWIGDGVSYFSFAYDPGDTVAAVYRTRYGTRYGGPFTWFTSSDTLADSTWTRDSTEAGTWNYKSVTATNIDIIRWMQVERIGKVAADTVGPINEVIYIQSK